MNRLKIEACDKFVGWIHGEIDLQPACSADPMIRFPFLAAVNRAAFCVWLFCVATVFAQESAFELKLADGTVASGQFKDVTIVLTDQEGSKRAISFAELRPAIQDRLLKVFQQETARQKANAEIGKIVDIIDGDTVRFQDEDGKTRTIRLYQIDAPEWNQPFGKEAARYLAGLVKGKTVSIIARRFDDKYGRDIADLYVDDMWVVGHLVEKGYAWNYVAYSDSAEIVALGLASK